MRIATSTIYDQQTAAIDNLSASYQTLGQELSTGKLLTSPSANPSVIAQDLTLSGTLASEQGTVTNATAASNQLTFVDSTLSSLTDVLQQARSLAVSSASDLPTTASEHKVEAQQFDQLLQQVISLANTQYAGQYIFAGTASNATPPVTAQGSPATGVAFSGNLNQPTVTINGQTFALGATLSQAFSYASPTGSPDVFQILANLRDLLNSQSVTDTSGTAVNAAGTYLTTNTSLAALETGAGASLAATPLVPDSSGNVSFSLSGTDPTTGQPASQTLTFNPATTTIGSVVSAINAANLGVSAQWDEASQKLVLTSTAANGTGTFALADVASPGATNTANFLETFGLQTEADTVTAVSSHLGEIDTALNNLLSTRATIGQQIQNLSSIQTQVCSQITQNQAVQSGYEDVNVAQATSQFTAVQTALQAAYATTSRLEGKSLIDYLPTP
jgi:flagellar hook-associated protein 3 FlgL